MTWLKNYIQLVGRVHQEIAAMPAEARRKGWARVAVVLVIAACIAALAGCGKTENEAPKEALRKVPADRAFDVGDPTTNTHKAYRGGWPPGGQSGGQK